MRRFMLGWKTLGLAARLRARIVNFAGGDFVICCRGTGKQAMEAMRAMMNRLKLTVNEEKTGRWTREIRTSGATSGDCKRGDGPD